jgi:hypothetical protein
MLQIIFGVLGILLAFGGDRLSMPILLYAGVACFGLASIAIGWEAIIMRHIQLGSRRRGTGETYTGLAAVLHGVQFNLIGLFLIGLSLSTYINNGREIVLQFVRRPGVPLLLFGALCLMQAIISLTGSHELKQGPRWMVAMNLFAARLLPGIILIVIGVGAAWLGVFEVIAPGAFDEMGGGYLEVLYGVK